MSELIDAVLDALGASESVREAVRKRADELQRDANKFTNMTGEEQDAYLDNAFERVLFAFQGEDEDAHIVRMILNPFRDVAHKLTSEANYIQHNKGLQPSISPEVSSVAIEFMRLADRFLVAFANLAAARATALGLKAPIEYVPPSAKKVDDPEEKPDTPNISNGLNGVTPARDDY
jgi:hypothetical protein